MIDPSPSGQIFGIDRSAAITTVTLAGLIIVLQALPQAAELLRYEQLRLRDGSELWRVFSAHLVHLGWYHALTNAAALLAMAYLFADAWRSKDLIAGGLFCALNISLALYFFHESIGWYVGLSGVLHGYFLLASARMCATQKRFGLGLLIGLGLKLAYEQLTGANVDSELLGGKVVGQAHFWGACAALGYYAVERCLGMTRKLDAEC